MNLDERIESAWKEQSSEARKWLQCSRESQLLRAAGFGFEEGYRAAMRSLYVEVKPRDMKMGREYIVWISEEYSRERWLDRVMVSLSDDTQVCRGSAMGWDYWPRSSVVSAYLRSDIPSPAEVFGGTK